MAQASRLFSPPAMLGRESPFILVPKLLLGNAPFRSSSACPPLCRGGPVCPPSLDAHHHFFPIDLLFNNNYRLGAGVPDNQLSLTFLAKEKGLRKSSQPSKFGGGRWATRTPGLWFRRPTLYPPELIAHVKNHIRFRPSVKTDRSGAGLAQDLLPGKGALPGPGQSHNLMASKGPWFTGGVLPRATHRRPSAG